MTETVIKRVVVGLDGSDIVPRLWSGRFNSLIR